MIFVTGMSTFISSSEQEESIIAEVMKYQS